MPHSDPFDLAGRCFVIIGGTAGLGRGAAVSLAEAGANLVVVGRSKENLASTLEQLGDSGAGVAGDASDPGTAGRAVDLAVERFGKLSGLYHVAGGSGRSKGDGPVHEISDEGWEYTVGLNLSSVIYSNRAAVRQFLKQGDGGVILNMGSVLGSSPSPRFFASHAYAATKAGIEGFSKSAASYYAPENIRINVIAPALVETPMSGRASADDEIMEFIRTKQPLDGGRIGVPDDYEGAVRFLLSDASRFMTGQVVTVDGGWSVSEGQIPPGSMRYAIGIDLGGTRIKAGAFECESGEVLARETADTRDGEWDGNVPAFAESARAAVARFAESLGSEPEATGVSAPGLVDAAGRAIRFMPGRLEGLEGFNWADYLGRPVRVMNDAQAALWGEVWQGGAAGIRNVFLLTLGTGVGGAVVCDGKLLRGCIGRAGHLGHLSLDFEGAPDICGTPGSLEDLIGNATVGERSGGRFKSTRALLDAVTGGDERAAAIWRDSVKALAAGVASLVNVLDPEVVLIGGGVAEAGAALFDPLAGFLDQFEWRPAGHRVEVRPAKLGEWAGCYGAAYYAMGDGANT